MSINSLQELGSDIQSATKRIEEYNKNKSNMDENYVSLKKKLKQIIDTQWKAYYKIMALEQRFNKLENMQSKEKSLNKRIEELENNIKNINKRLEKHSSLEKKINILNTKTNVLEKYRYLSPQESKDIDQFGFKKEQIVSKIKEKLDKIESSSQRSERLEIITDLFKYM